MGLLLRKWVFCWENLSIAEKMCFFLRKCVCCWENVSVAEKMCLFLRKCGFFLRKCVFSWENVSIAEKMCLLLRKCVFSWKNVVFSWENVSIAEKMCLLLKNVSFAQKMCLLLRKCVFCWEKVASIFKNWVDFKAFQDLAFDFTLLTHMFLVALDVLHFRTIQHLFWALVKHKWLAKFSSIFAWKLATFELMCASKNNFFSVTKWRRYVEKQENEITL